MNIEHPTANMEQRTEGRGWRVLEGLALLCLLASPLVAPVLIGGSRLWASGPLMALAFLGALLVGVRALRGSGAAAALHVPPGTLAWLGFLGYSAVAIFLYGNPYEARVELLRAASLWAAYWAWANLGVAARQWRWVLALLLLAAAANALYGLYNHFMGMPDRVLWFDRLEEKASYGERISGTYFCPNHWANWLALLAPVALALVFTAEAGVLLRLLAAGALLVFPLAIHVSQSRAGLIGLVVGLMVTTLALAWRRSRLLFAMLLVALPLLVAGGGYVYWQHSPVFRARVASVSEELNPDQAFRLNTWRDTLLMFQAQPWVGHGPGSYPWALEAHRQYMRDTDHQSLYAHNDYLQSIAEYGIAGTALVALPLAWILLRFLGVARRRTTPQTTALLLAGVLGAWAAALAHATLDFNLHIYANLATLAALSGLVAGRLQGQRDWVLPAAGRALCRVGAALTALLLGVMGWTLVSYYLEVRANHAFLAINYAAGERAARLALRVDGANWYAEDTLGNLLQSRARWGQDERERKADAEGAVQAFARAAAGNRHNMETRFEQGMALIACGSTEEGLRLVRLAADTHPWIEMYRSQLGVQLRQAGRYPEALEEFRKAAKIKWNPMINNNIVWLEKQVKEAEEKKKKL